jgi:NDP-hexose 4,6-dehydratase
LPARVDTTGGHVPADTLVTGADGFVGSHLVEGLLDRGASVIAVVRRTSRSQVTHDFPNLAHCLRHERLTLATVDLAGRAAVSVLSSPACAARTWLHLAADAYVPASFEQPAAVIDNNVSSAVNVLEAARTASVENVVMASSSEVYGESLEPIDERTLLEPTTPYAASKAAADRVASAYWRTFELPVTIVRPFNCYGPRHVYDVIPKFISSALTGDVLTIHGDGSQRRDFTYVSDLVDAFVRVAERPSPGEVYNVGTGVDTSVREVAELVLDGTGRRSDIVFAQPRPGDLMRLCADATKIRNDLGWSPTVALETGLEWNIEWFKRVMRDKGTSC